MATIRQLPLVSASNLTSAALFEIEDATGQSCRATLAQLSAQIQGVAPAAGALTGTTMAANVVASSLTSVGTLAGLTMGGAITLASSGLITGGSSGVLFKNAAGTRTNFTWNDAGSVASLFDGTSGITLYTLTAAGEVPAGGAIRPFVANSNLTLNTTLAAQTSKLVLAYYDGTQSRSAVEVANATGFSTLLLMKSGGGVTTGGSLTAATGFGCNSKTAQTAYASGGAVVTTAPALASYGYTQAQAAAILTLLNNIQAALVANGIMS